MKYIRIFVLLFLTIFTQCQSPNQKEIKTKVENGAFIVDVRMPDEFASGSFKGAVNIPLGDIESRLDDFKGKENIIVFCQSGNRSGKAKDILEANGFENVTNGISQKNMEEKTK